MPGVIRVEQVPKGVLKRLLKGRGVVLRRRRRTETPAAKAAPETTPDNLPPDWGVCLDHGMAWYPRRAGCPMCEERA